MMQEKPALHKIPPLGYKRLGATEKNTLKENRIGRAIFSSMQWL